jgi:hypothetical protein
MADRNKHVGKSNAQRFAYNRYIRTLDYEPTINESIDFGSTEKGGEELSESISRRTSRGHTKRVIFDHLKEHWVTWLIGALVILGLYLVNESRVTTAIMGNALNDNTKTIDTVKTDVKSLSNKVNTLEIQSALNAKDIEYLKVNK